MALAASNSVREGAANATINTWVLCAAEGSTCAFTGTRTVRYGANSAFVEKSLSNGAACGNGIFGDPIMGVAKSCWLATAVEVTWKSRRVAGTCTCSRHCWREVQ
jgi:hypothetical protein